ncbi:protein MNN4-like [Pyrus ussuriensis x Pyrus communis]|uniref:Protein MNN4-like n=1 Tax=Pyrus ussuriensis x Pyrus communis TaxID=2448454 RepID=A0A5N5GSY4_9ROSA|nr:protein MNN4-like [Pyrus ussuriensis x Pyrus communis]KAB2634973.1 protein MNN4-like [Pyrus ussuriensis x Pyrus communis]
MLTCNPRVVGCTLRSAVADLRFKGLGGQLNPDQLIMFKDEMDDFTGAMVEMVVGAEGEGGERVVG